MITGVWNGYYSTLGAPGGVSEVRKLPYVVDFTDTSNVKLCDQASVDEYYLSLFKLAKEFKEKGYWSSDALLISDCAYDSFSVGTGASFSSSISECYNKAQTYNASNPDWDCRIYRVTDQPLLQQSPLNNCMAVNATSKNYERALMVLDLLRYDQSYYDLTHYGFEGTDYTLDADGKITTTGTFGGAAISMGFVTTAARTDAGEDPAYTELKTGASCLPLHCQLVFDASNLTTEVAMVNQITDKYLPILALGMAEDVEATYAQFKAEIETAGGQDIINEYISQVQAQLDAKA